MGGRFIKPVIDHWWQTETSWTIAGNYKGLGLFKTKYGSAGKPAPGYDVKVLKSDGSEAKPGEMGDICKITFATQYISNSMECRSKIQRKLYE